MVIIWTCGWDFVRLQVWHCENEVKTLSNMHTYINWFSSSVRTSNSNQELHPFPSAGIGQFPSPKESIFDKKSKKQDKKSKGSKLRKEDIGLPSNFQHLGHVGWDKDKGFQVGLSWWDAQKEWGEWALGGSGFFSGWMRKRDKREVRKNAYLTSH